MELFNPWLGFPARNAVYLDQDFPRMRGNGQRAYGTFQTAYNAASALATALGERVVIMVGEGTAAQLGNLVLTANWNTNVSISGINKHASTVGTITASDALADGFDVVLTASNITIGNITSQGIVSGGNVTITGNGMGAVTIGAIDTSSTDGLGGGGTAGAAVLSDVTCGSVTTTGDTTGGDVTLTRSFSTGGITTNSDNGESGIVTIDEGSTCGDINVEAIAALGGARANTVIVTDKSTVGNVTVGNSPLDFTLTVNDSKLGGIINIGGVTNTIKISKSQINSDTIPCFAFFTNGCIAENCLMVVSGVGNISCLADLAQSTTGILVNCTLIPSGTAACISDPVGATIFCSNVLAKNDADPLVAVNGLLTTMPSLISPL